MPLWNRHKSRRAGGHASEDQGERRQDGADMADPEPTHSPSSRPTDSQSSAFSPSMGHGQPPQQPVSSSTPVASQPSTGFGPTGASGRYNRSRASAEPNPYSSSPLPSTQASPSLENQWPSSLTQASVHSTGLRSTPNNPRQNAPSSMCGSPTSAASPQNQLRDASGRRELQRRSVPPDQGPATRQDSFRRQDDIMEPEFRADRPDYSRLPTETSRQDTARKDGTLPQISERKNDPTPTQGTTRPQEHVSINASPVASLSPRRETHSIHRPNPPESLNPSNLPVDQTASRQPGRSERQSMPLSQEQRVLSAGESFLFPNGPVERSRQLGLAEIEKFLQTYERLQAHWQVLKDCAIEIIKTKMKEKDIRGQVTGRVKDFESLKTKLLQRNSRAPYKDDEAILNDGLDFVGLRIALYLPDDQPKVELLLKEAFVYESTTTFDRDWDYRRPQAYRKRFGEYTADHVWVKLNKGGQLLYYKMFKEYQRDSITGTSIIYQSQPLEIQLRSVLMDAWANLSHFLEYKHLDGALSGKEMQLLDAIKGQVEGAELLIDILHQEHNKRITNNKRRIDSVEDVNDIVTEYIPADLLHKIPHGDMSLLLKYLQMIDHATPYKLRKLMAEVSTGDDIRAGLAAWVRDYDPLPTTISYYITSRVFSHGQLFYTRNQRSESERSTTFPRVTTAIKEALLWIHEGLFHQHVTDRHLSPVQIQRCAFIWCVYVWFSAFPESIPTQHGFGMTSRRGDPTAGIDFITNLSLLGLLPVIPHLRSGQKVHGLFDPESEQPVRRNPPGGATRPFPHLYSFLIHQYLEDREAWAAGFQDFRDFRQDVASLLVPPVRIDDGIWYKLSTSIVLASHSMKNELEEYIDNKFHSPEIESLAQSIDPNEGSPRIPGSIWHNGFSL